MDAPPPAKQPASQSLPVMVTATVGSQRVRYISIGEVNQMRLQIFSTDGTQVFDSDFRLGNLLDWQLQDQQGAHLIDGSYLFLVTVKDFSGTLTQKYGMALLEQEQVSLLQTSRDELPQAQASALNASQLSPVMTSIDRVGAAALNRISDSTGDGATTIDAGGNSQKTNKAISGTNIAGAGTQGRIAKWTDNSGTLGDSIMLEVGTNVGIGTSTPGTINEVSFPTIPFHLFRANNSSYMAVDSSGIGSYSGLVLNRSSANPNQRMWVVDAQPSADLTSSVLSFSTYNDAGTPTPRMTLDRSGNVGIGTTAPKHHLSINGGPSWTSNQWSGAVEMTNGSAIGWQSNNGGQRFGIGQSNGGLYFFRTTSNPGTTASPANFAMVINDSGNIGIGTLSPTTQLYVLSSTSGLSAIYGESASGRGVWGKSVGSRGIFGESNSGEGVHGESISGVGVAAQGVTGVTGLGTTGSGVYGESPAASLTAAGVYGKGTGSSSIGVTGEANIGNAVGVFGVSTSPSGYGVYARSVSGGQALYADGNASQNLSSNGFVKAMLEVANDGSIIKCYNGHINSSTGNCGFTITQPQPRSS